MDALLFRSGGWLFAFLLAVAAAAMAVDGPFAIQMGIVALAALITLGVTIAKADWDGIKGLRPAVPATGYYDDVIRWGVIATMFWGMAGFLAGLYIALQLAFPALNLGLEYTTFGRLRPLHTSAVIFAFGGNALLSTSFWVVQRTCRARLAFPPLARFVFWGYQLFIVLAATGYMMGLTEGKEYAEPEWYVDIWLTIVWVSYLIVYLGTIIKRHEPHIYVANWFYLAFIITVAMLHLVNNLSMPVSIFGSKSYSAFAGVQDALTQWWYGHNAVEIGRASCRERVS
jgi:cytochrome c oxidase cbb3-type subunit 1